MYRAHSPPEDTDFLYIVVFCEFYIRNSFSITERNPGLSPASLKLIHESTVMKSRPPPSDFEMLNYNTYAENFNLVTTVISFL
jgi:hypothetical protein